ncbi:MAG: hypothetical protein P1U39_01080 [Legionellaceae bacterium]|nr:hypothetical protein [Legionellaceae bacterium]
MAIRIKKPTDPDTYLADDTVERENLRRPLEQAGLRRLSGMSVQGHDRDVPTESAGQDLDQQMSAGVEEHPLLDKQQFDGIDASVNPAPPLSDAEARREFDNARNEQQLQKQMKLGLAPKMNTAPKPPGP